MTSFMTTIQITRQRFAYILDGVLNHFSRKKNIKNNTNYYASIKVAVL